MCVLPIFSVNIYVVTKQTGVSLDQRNEMGFMLDLIKVSYLRFICPLTGNLVKKLFTMSN